MESTEMSGLELEQRIITVGKFLNETSYTLSDVGSDFLEELLYLVASELEKREATLQ
jgi:hypothetical protein